MTDLKHVTKWCEEFSEAHGVKIFPQSAPILNMIENIMERLIRLRQYHDNLVFIYNSLNERVTQIEKDMLDCNIKLLELENPIEEIKQHEETIKVRGVDVPIKDLVKKPIKKEVKK